MGRSSFSGAEQRKGETTMMRGQFTFYRSFYEALKHLPARARLAAYEAIIAYALDGVEPELTGTAATAFVLIRPVLDSARRKASGGMAERRSRGTDREDGEKMPGRQAKESANKGENEAENENETERDVEREAEGEGESPAPPAYERPDYETVLREARRRGCGELARAFFDYYDAAGWRDREGRPVRSWRQKLVLWQEREEKKGYGGKKSPGTQKNPAQERESMDRDYERMEKYLEELRAQ